MTTTYDEIKVYWDATDPNNEGWAYEAWAGGKIAESGSIEVDTDDLDVAIEEAVRVLDAGVRTDQFAREPYIDGGFATWTAIV